METLMQIHPNIVRDAVSRSGISKAEIARRAEVHPNSLVGIEVVEAWNPKWFTLEALCKAVDEIKRERA